MALFLVLTTSGLLSFFLTGAVRRYALRTDLLDNPNHRSSHVVATPRGGGLAILISVTISLMLALIVGATMLRDAVTVTVGMWTLGVVGWLDDRHTLSSRLRLAVHFTVALWTLYMFGGLPAIRTGTTVISLGWFGFVVGALGIVWSINLFNFMDGIDGLAGSQATLIFGVVGLLLATGGIGSLATISVAVSAAAAGFLVWNWPPAKIFLGDVGSGPLGYLMAALAVGAENRGGVPLLFVAAIAGVFITDATITLVRRLLRGERLDQAHRSHAYQRLARAAGSHRPVSIGAALVTIALSALAVLAVVRAEYAATILVMSFLVPVALFVLVERRAPLARPESVAGEEGPSG